MREDPDSTIECEQARIRELEELKQQIALLRRDLASLAQQEASAKGPATDLQQAKQQAYEAARALERQLAEPVQHAVFAAFAYVKRKITNTHDSVRKQPFVLVSAALLAGSVMGRFFCHGR